MKNEPVAISKIIIEKNMNYKDTPVLHYRIEYPRFRYPSDQGEPDEINEWYRNQAKVLQRQYETELYREAAELYDYSMKNQYPFHMFDAVDSYEITCNMDDIISLYYDHYTYTGGAHGGTVRRSDTWNAADGSRIDLYQYAHDPTVFRAEILNDIREQIALQIERGENMYFEDYPQLIEEYFNPESFYLTPEGIVIYYQQYEIAPYASGIPEFNISGISR